ncbi:relaxase [Streptococcus macedonicus]|uniref:Relaxase n=1 Tax=Streptococcus macedonicus TaxID=59310 RepID=A0AAP8FZW3_STRMC|nr:relaxase/mobilization nuclease domain-containing protein [Streptococcus macedonicus]PHV58690.1 relaxase [Streptococcus macedonicus]
MVYTKVFQIKNGHSLKRAIDYIERDDATVIGVEEHKNDDGFDYVLGEEGTIQKKLISSHLLTDANAADIEMMQLKKLANLQKGRPFNYEELVENDVLAHHIIQSFSPEDNLTPEEVNEIGRKTALEFTGGNHQFVVATHMDKGHLHNHIIFNTTNSVTLNKFRWNKGTYQALKQISDKHADLAGAKIIEKNPFGHKEYATYQKENVFKVEIKARLEFLLKNATSIDDFQKKAAALNLAVDFSGKYVKYKLLDKPQKNNTRDRMLSKKRRYSLENIQARVAKNEIVYPLEKIKEEYDKLQAEKADDFEIKLTLEPWQVDQETKTGIYLKLQYGIANEGTVKIPNRLIDKLPDGSFEIFVKRSDFFYFINPDNSQSNKFMKGSTLINQLSDDSGQYILTKNPYISKLSLLVKEYNYLVSHHVSDAEQFQELRDRFIAQIKETQSTLKTLDTKIERLNKIASALKDYQAPEPVAKEVAKKTLDQFGVLPTTAIQQIDKQVVEVTLERKTLKETFDKIVEDFTQYERLEKHAATRREEAKNKFNEQEPF